MTTNAHNAEKGPATPRRMRSERRVRDEAEMARDAVLDDDPTDPSLMSPDDWMNPSTFPTLPADTGLGAYASAVDEIRRLYAAGEVEAALDLAALVRPAAGAFSRASVPVVVLTREEILKLPLDARLGFFLARIDGVTNVETLLDTAPMPEADAIDLLEELVALGAIRVVPPGGEVADGDTLELAAG